jgi:hypothetical protein
LLSELAQLYLECGQIHQGDRRAPSEPAAGLTRIEKKAFVLPLVHAMGVTVDHEIIGAALGKRLGKLGVVNYRNIAILQGDRGQIGVNLTDFSQPCCKAEALTVVVAELNSSTAASILGTLS